MRVYAFLSILSVSMLLLAFCQTAPVHAAASWNVQTVDTRAAGQGNGYCPIVVDSDNVPSIAYSGYNYPPYTYGIVRYARWNGSGWSTQEVDPYADTFDLELDANGNPHILYGLSVLKYASWTGLNWSIQTVGTAGSAYAALALDSAGHPHVAFSTHETLYYASRSGSNWTTETVDTGTDIPIQLSLAMDSNDKPYIMYSNQGLKLATLENGGWNIQNVTLPDPASGVGNMVLDSKGHPHLIYCVFSGSDETIKYASWTGGSWKTQTVASGLSLDYIGNPGFLALDSLDYPHICYVSGFSSGHKLGYAVWTGLDWSIQTVGEAFGRSPVYMAVDSNRIPHVSYRAGNINDPTNNQMYATASEPVPLASPLLIALPLLLVLAVVIGAIVVVVYLWKKKT
jgi:hypothetical protein